MTSYPAVLLQLEGARMRDRARVRLVAADRDGLSFRTRKDVEVVRVAADRILSIELAPLDPRNRLRPARAALADGAPVEFWIGNDPDRQAEIIVALRTALGRAG